MIVARVVLVVRFVCVMVLMPVVIFVGIVILMLFMFVVTVMIVMFVMFVMFVMIVMIVMIIVSPMILRLAIAVHGLYRFEANKECVIYGGAGRSQYAADAKGQLVMVAKTDICHTMTEHERVA